MTKEEALQVLDQATQRIQGTRADHAIIIKALQILSELVEKDSKNE
jgi:hypothetical protein